LRRSDPLSWLLTPDFFSRLTNDFLGIEDKKGAKREPQKIIPCWKGNLLSYHESTDTQGKKSHWQENLEIRASGFFQSLIDCPG
jgi:hypothetical protein